MKRTSGWKLLSVALVVGMFTSLYPAHAEDQATTAIVAAPKTIHIVEIFRAPVKDGMFISATTLAKQIPNFERLADAMKTMLPAKKISGYMLEERSAEAKDYALKYYATATRSEILTPAIPVNLIVLVDGEGTRESLVKEVSYCHVNNSTFEVRAELATKGLHRPLLEAMTQHTYEAIGGWRATIDPSTQGLSVVLILPVKPAANTVSQVD